MRELMKISNRLLEGGFIPDPIIRFGIRGLLKDKLIEEAKFDQQLGSNRVEQLVKQLKDSPIAVNTQEANEQHYELPAEFFTLIMGRHMKYSCGYWRDEKTDFDGSERDMLEITAERADIKDGQTILELGCGWGSFTLFAAERFPNSTITGVSNSHTQRKYIENQAQLRGIKNIKIITADMNTFSIDQKFDRVVSIEMFEHMRNYQRLLNKIAGFLNDDGKLFVHIFTHKKYAYLYDEKDEFDWIGKYFFTGGIMPSNDLLFYFNENFQREEYWQVNGQHYQKTSEGWLKNMDRNKDKIIPVLKDTYGEDQYKKWWVYWRVFFMSCAELWGYKNGNEWMVCHYRFVKKV